MKRTTALRLAFTSLVALVVLGAATVAAAAPSAKGERQFGASAERSALKLSPAVKRALRASRTAAAGRSLAGSALAGAADLGPGEHPGFAYCGNDYVYAWPAYSPTNDVTITRTHFIFSANGTFSDAVVESGPYYVIQDGEDYYLFEIALGEIVYGPTEYADGWVPFYLPDNTDYIGFVNEVIEVNSGVPAPAEFHLLTAIGPSVTTPPIVCQP